MGKTRDALGDRMKLYEGTESDRRLMPRLPVMARLDGRCFSKLTRNLKRPYDERMSRLMQYTLSHLMEHAESHVGYTQSDEISLGWYCADDSSQLFLDRRVQKLTSILASMATAYFNRGLDTYIPELAGKLAHFDCRVWNVPTLDEAANTFLWRELDAAKNSISMAAHTYFSHNALMGKHSGDMHEMLCQKGINWNDYPAFFKRGVWALRRCTVRRFNAEEIDKLPEKHEARTNPNLVVERNDVHITELPPLNRIVNRVDVLFRGGGSVMLANTPTEGNQCEAKDEASC